MTLAVPSGANSLLYPFFDNLSRLRASVGVPDARMLFACGGVTVRVRRRNPERSRRICCGRSSVLALASRERKDAAQYVCPIGGQGKVTIGRGSIRDRHPIRDQSATRQLVDLKGIRQEVAEVADSAHESCRSQEQSMNDLFGTNGSRGPSSHPPAILLYLSPLVSASKEEERIKAIFSCSQFFKPQSNRKLTWRFPISGSDWLLALEICFREAFRERFRSIKTGLRAESRNLSHFWGPWRMWRKSRIELMFSRCALAFVLRWIFTIRRHRLKMSPKTC